MVRKSNASLLLGCLGIAAVILLDTFHWNNMLQDRIPEYSPGLIIRSLVLFLSVLALLSSFVWKRKPQLVLFDSKGISFEWISIFTTLIISIIFLYIFLTDKVLFNGLVLEDGLIEWGSAILLFISFIIMSFAFIKSRMVTGFSKLTTYSLLFLSIIFLLIGLEEVSWFQRTLEIETPLAFEGNLQKEINLHNFATEFIENAYYFGTFLFLVVLPVLGFLIPSLSNNHYLRIFIARPFIAVICTFPFAYNYDMWNIIFTQISFFGSIVVLFIFAFLSKLKKERILIIVTLVIVVLSQILFLYNGENFTRLWDITEYKEFLIPHVFLIYAIDLLTRVIRSSNNGRGLTQS